MILPSENSASSYMGPFGPFSQALLGPLLQGNSGGMSGGGGGGGGGGGLGGLGQLAQLFGKLGGGAAKSGGNPLAPDGGQPRNPVNGQFMSQDQAAAFGGAGQGGLGQSQQSANANLGGQSGMLGFGAPDQNYSTPFGGPTPGMLGGDNNGWYQGSSQGMAQNQGPMGYDQAAIPWGGDTSGLGGAGFGFG